MVPQMHVARLSVRELVTQRVMVMAIPWLRSHEGKKEVGVGIMHGIYSLDSGWLEA